MPSAEPTVVIGEMAGWISPHGNDPDRIEVDYHPSMMVFIYAS